MLVSWGSVNFFVSCTTVYRWVITNCCFMSEMFLICGSKLRLHFVGFKRSLLICWPYYCTQPRIIWRRNAHGWFNSVLLISVNKWLATDRMAKLRFPVRSLFSVRQHVFPNPVWTFLHLDTRWRIVFGFTPWPTVSPGKELGACVPMQFRTWPLKENSIFLPEILSPWIFSLSYSEVHDACVTNINSKASSAKIWEA